MMKFSVLASVYIKEIPSNLDLALESIFNQTQMPDEIVLVKDGPLNKDLDAIVAKYQRKSPQILKVIPLKKNVGLGAALNKGLQHVTNEVVARVDTDDICYSNRFEKQIKFLESNSDISVVGGMIQEFNKVPGDLHQFRKLPLTHTELYKFAKYRNPLSHPSVMFRKTAIIKAGSYKDMLLFEDYYLWIRILQKGYKIANINDTILHFRIGNDMVGRRSGLSYAKKELNFLRAIRSCGFISVTEFLYSITIKIPLRILPKSVLSIVYEKFLR